MRCHAWAPMPPCLRSGRCLPMLPHDHVSSACMHNGSCHAPCCLLHGRVHREQGYPSSSSPDAHEGRKPSSTISPLEPSCVAPGRIRVVSGSGALRVSLEVVYDVHRIRSGRTWRGWEVTVHNPRSFTSRRPKFHKLKLKLNLIPLNLQGARRLVKRAGAGSAARGGAP
jgi:hypothetical protein